MTIKKIILENFKSHKRTELELSRINIIIGPNSSGKSSIFQALLLLKRLIVANYNIGLDQALNFLGVGYVNLGSFNDIKHLKRHGPVTISILTNAVSYGIEIQNTNTVTVKFTINTENLKLNAERNLNLPYTQPSSISGSLETNKGRFPFTWDGRFNFQFQAPAPPREIMDVFNRIKMETYNMLRDIYIIPWFKLGFANPTISLATGDIRAQFVIPEGFIANEIFRNADIHDYIEDSTGELFKRRVRYHPQQNALELYVSLKRGRTIKLVNEGGGLNRFTYIIGSILCVPENSCILIEEPEVNLHPKAQYELVRYIAELAKDFNRQLIITTHSEHLLNGFLNCIRKKKLNVNDLTIYSFEFDNREYKTIYKKLEIDESGRIERGLTDFFEEEIRELIEMLEESKTEE